MKRNARNGQKCAKCEKWAKMRENAQKCAKMRENAQTCAKMRENARKCANTIMHVRTVVAIVVINNGKTVFFFQKITNTLYIDVKNKKNIIPYIYIYIYIFNPG